MRREEQPTQRSNTIRVESRFVCWTDEKGFDRYGELIGYLDDDENWNDDGQHAKVKTGPGNSTIIHRDKLRKPVNIYDTD